MNGGWLDYVYFSFVTYATANCRLYCQPEMVRAAARELTIALQNLNPSSRPTLALSRILPSVRRPFFARNERSMADSV